MQPSFRKNVWNHWNDVSRAVLIISLGHVGHQPFEAIHSKLDEVFSLFFCPGDAPADHISTNYVGSNAFRTCFCVGRESSGSSISWRLAASSEYLMFFHHLHESNSFATGFSDYAAFPTGLQPTLVEQNHVHFDEDIFRCAFAHRIKSRSRVEIFHHC